MYNQSSGFNSSLHIRGSIPSYIKRHPRRLVWIAVIPVLMIPCLWACSEKRAHCDALAKAETLMQDYPDSALAILETLDPASLGSAEGRARYALLLSRARHRCYIEETDDSLISTAVDYYSAHPFDSQVTSTNYLMLALYYQGVIRENDNNLIMALRSYLKAEGEAIQRNDHYFLGYIYRHFCLLYENIHAGKESVYYGRKSFEEFSKAGTEGNIAYAANELGHAFAVYCEYDSALTWACHCLSLPFTQRDTLLQTDALRLSGETSFKLGRYNDAIGYYNRFKSVSPGRFNDYDARRLARILFATGDHHTAYEVCREYLGADTSDLHVPYEILYARGNTEGAFRALQKQLYDDSQTSVNNARQDLTRALAEFREQEVENEVSHRLRDQLMWILVSSLIIAVCVIFMLMLQGRIKRNRKALDNAMLKVEILNEDLRNQLTSKRALLNEKEQVTRNLDELTREHERLKLDLEQQENEKVRTVSNYCQLLESQIQQIEEMTHLYSNDTESKAKNKKLFKRISRLISNYSDPKFLNGLENQANRFHDDILRRFRETFPDLRDEEVRLFLYQVFGFSGRTISFLLNEDLTIIYSRRSRLKGKISRSQSPDRDLFLSFFS